MATIKWKNGDGDIVHLPATWVVCSECEGEGSIVHPDIGAITASEWSDWVLDEREEYMAGKYDVTCPRCGGRRVVLEPDWENMAPDVADEYERYLLGKAAYAAERSAERRLGA